MFFVIPGGAQRRTRNLDPIAAKFRVCTFGAPGMTGVTR